MDGLSRDGIALIDWRSSEGIALLRQAYPCGYLATRGVLTLGGWVCRGSGDADEGGEWELPTAFVDSDGKPCRTGALRPHQFTWWKRWGNFTNCSSDFYDLRDTGALLPLPDPRDVSTWAALLWSLGSACAEVQPLLNQRNPQVTGLGWMRQKPPGVDHHAWWLTVTNARAAFFHSTQPFYLDTPDPAEALVRAVIQARILRGQESSDGV